MSTAAARAGGFLTLTASAAVPPGPPNAHARTAARTRSARRFRRRRCRFRLLPAPVRRYRRGRPLLAFSASRRSPALTNDATPRAIVSFGADSRAAPSDERRHAGRYVDPVRTLPARHRRRRRFFFVRRCNCRRRRRRSCSTCGATAHERSRPSRVFATLRARGGGRRGGRDVRRDVSAGVPSYGHRGVRADASRAGRGGLRKRRSRLLALTRGAAAEGGWTSRRRALVSLSSHSPMRGLNTVASAALPPAAHVLSTSRSSISRGTARDQSPAPSASVCIGDARRGVWGGEGRARSRLETW